MQNPEMPQTTRTLACAAAMLALSTMGLAPASAQQPMQKMRPGLWEHTISMASQSGQIEAPMAQAQKSLAAMPPAQRKQMEDMLAAQGQGIRMNDKGHSTKVCVTPEQAAMDSFPQQGGCTQKMQRVDASTLKVRFSCKGDADNPATSGDGTVTLQGPKAYTGQFKIHTTGASGKPDRIGMAQSGKWLSEACGATPPALVGH